MNITQAFYRSNKELRLFIWKEYKRSGLLKELKLCLSDCDDDPILKNKGFNWLLYPTNQKLGIWYFKSLNDLDNHLIDVMLISGNILNKIFKGN